MRHHSAARALSTLAVSGLLLGGMVLSLPAQSGGRTVTVSSGEVAGSRPSILLALATNSMPFVINGLESTAAWSTRSCCTNDRLGATLYTLGPTGEERADVVIRGTSGAVWHKAYAGGAWSLYSSVGGDIQGVPAITTTNEGCVCLHVFGRGADNALWHTTWDGSRWADWDRLDATMTLASSPTAQGNPGSLHVVARMADGSLQSKRWTKAGGWQAWRRIGSADAGEPSSVRAPAAMGASAPIQVFYRSGDKVERAILDADSVVTTTIALPPADYVVVPAGDGTLVFLRQTTAAEGEAVQSTDAGLTTFRAPVRLRKTSDGTR